ncbi:MAG: peroxiredoxin family protein [Thermoleophilia bacterium]
MRRTGPIVFGLMLLTLVVAVGCGGTGQSTAGEATQPPPAAEARSAAAPFSGVSLDGSSVSLESFRGKPLALIFWASW